MRFMQIVGILVSSAVMLSGSTLLGISGHAGNPVGDSWWAWIVMVAGLVSAAYFAGLFSTEKPRKKYRQK